MIVVVSLIPIAVYCLILAIINRRRCPLIVSGAWDFAGVLFAASGILLVGGPAILTALYEQWHLARLLGQPRYLQGIGEYRIFWTSLWLLYFAVVAGGSTLVLWRRRRLTSIYNVEPEVFTEVLTQVLDRLGAESFRYGSSRWFIRSATKNAPKGDSVYSQLEPGFGDGNQLGASVLAPQRSPAGTIPVVAEEARLPADSLAYPSAELDLDFFPAMRHVTLRWGGQRGRVRSEIEAGLAEALALVRTRRSPVTIWFFSLTLALFFVAFVMLTALIAMQILQLRR